MLPVGERKDSIARAAVVRALCRLAEQRGVAVRVAVGKDNGEAVCGQGGGAQRVEALAEVLVRAGECRAVGATAAMEASASPRNPIVWSEKRSSALRILEVA